jgi:hypothetical protein
LSASAFDGGRAGSGPAANSASPSASRAGPGGLAYSLALLFFCLYPVDTLAYIDPNAGGWLFQVLFPALVAIAGAWAVVRKRLAASWKKLFQRFRRPE